MATIKAMLNRDRATTHGLYPLVIRVIHNRQKRLIYSPYKMKPENFDPLNELVIPCDSGGICAKDIESINRYIEKQRAQLTKMIHWLEMHKSGDYSVGDIIIKLRQNKNERSLFNYMEREIESKTRINNFGTASLYRTTRESIKRFTDGRNITFNEINCKFINDYINHLQERGLGRNTINMYLRNLRLIYNKAQKEGAVSAKHSPFSGIKMNCTETVKRSLTKDIMRKIAFADLSSHKDMELARDIFLFSFYTRGMSLVDILHLKHSDIKNGVIYYSRSKTNQNLQITVTNQLHQLIDKYSTDSIYVMPYLIQNDPHAQYRRYRNAVGTINKHLKVVGKLLGIEISLTTYVARHSWATIAKSEGAPISAISEGLGHTTEKTTQIYLRAFDRSVIDEVNERVILL